MQPITEAHGTDNGRGLVYRVRTGDGVWYRISKADFDRLAETGGRGCLQVTTNVILMHQETWDRMIEMIRTRIERCEAIPRKPLLSGRYGKRRRQRAEGVAKYRHERRQEARRELESLRWRLREMTTEA